MGVDIDGHSRSGEMEVRIWIVGEKEIGRQDLGLFKPALVIGRALLVSILRP